MCFSCGQQVSTVFKLCSIVFLVRVYFAFASVGVWQFCVRLFFSVFWQVLASCCSHVFSWCFIDLSGFKYGVKQGCSSAFIRFVVGFLLAFSLCLVCLKLGFVYVQQVLVGFVWIILGFKFGFRRFQCVFRMVCFQPIVFQLAFVWFGRCFVCVQWVLFSGLFGLLSVGVSLVLSRSSQALVFFLCWCVSSVFSQLLVGFKQVSRQRFVGFSVCFSRPPVDVQSVFRRCWSVSSRRLVGIFVGFSMRLVGFRRFSSVCRRRFVGFRVFMLFWVGVCFVGFSFVFRECLVGFQQVVVGVFSQCFVGVQQVIRRLLVGLFQQVLVFSLFCNWFSLAFSGLVYVFSLFGGQALSRCLVSV